MNDTNNNGSTGITLQRALEVLQNGAFEGDLHMLRWSSNYTFVADIKHENDIVRAVYKPQKGERPLWDFPDGKLCNRELAAFLTSQELHWQIVPPTVVRDGPHGLGSLQFFVEHDPDEHYFSFDDSKVSYLKRIAAFDVLVNNADRKGGHCLVDYQGHVWGIDHGITFHSQNKLRTVIWDFAGQPLDGDLLADIEQLCGKVEDGTQSFHRTLQSLITEREINAFRNRIRLILKAKKYPQPGPSGPNYPWPPV
jgi:Phosphatidylinositol 3- and 4-kinase